MGVLDELQEAVARVAAGPGMAVVGVTGRWGSGSAVVLASGEVVTNAHNLRGEEVTVTFGDGRSALAQVAGVDVDGDLAVLEVDTGSVEPIEWPMESSMESPMESVDGLDAEIGRPVLALANPGGRGLRVTFGLISATQRSFRGPRGRRISGSLEHTAPLLPGSSGGPLVDLSGKLLGLNTHRLGEGFYLALPTDRSLRRRVEELARGEATVRPHLGIGIAPAHVARRLRRAVGLPEADGLLVRYVEEDRPAAEAGLQQGDLIVSAGGRPTPAVDDLFQAMDDAPSSLQLQVLRGSQELTIMVRTGG